MRRNKLFSSNERGATLVEFAIGVTVCLTSMFAGRDFGRALYTLNAQHDGARAMQHFIRLLMPTRSRT